MSTAATMAKIQRGTLTAAGSVGVAARICQDSVLSPAVGCSTISTATRLANKALSLTATKASQVSSPSSSLFRSNFHTCTLPALKAVPLKDVPFTAKVYPSITRSPDFNKLTPQDVDFFRSILSSPDLAVIYSESQELDDDVLLPYNVDWMRKYRGKSVCVLRPKTTEEMSKVLKYCNEKKLAVVPQGGNTGLVGGGVPVFDEVIISTARMDEIRWFDEVSGIVVADAGVILEKLDGWLAEKGYMCPLDLGAKGSCHIGGNVATNAGGLRLLRYGSLHGTVLGIEAVLPDGTILDNLSTLRKDNTGLDLKQLFIGSEGTLGIITGVSILTPKRASSVNVAMFSVDSFEAVQNVFKRAKADLGEILSAFEFWDKPARDLVKKHLTAVRDPLSADSKAAPFYVLIETQGSHQEHDSEKLNAFLEDVMENDIVMDGAVADNESQILNMWSVREGIPEACSKDGVVYKYDISLPVPVLYNLVEDVRTRLQENDVYRPGESESLVNGVYGYGHVGDGNLHLNVSAKEYSPKLTSLIEPYVYEWAQKYRGSISAEHGLGVMKASALKYSKDETSIELMRRIKGLFDPKGIMNPYKYLPPPASSA
ncbi:hypothetical protein HK102_002228 [Quaeritorhiza haematococci]|nr:hypothetical protein HK102_002228 [Quaeritorhiza haematococci]